MRPKPSLIFVSHFNNKNLASFTKRSAFAGAVGSVPYAREPGGSHPHEDWAVGRQAAVPAMGTTGNFEPVLAPRGYDPGGPAEHSWEWPPMDKKAFVEAQVSRREIPAHH